MINRLFKAHPASVGETYFEHMGAAASFAGAMAIGALACLIHALVPALCVRTGSGIVTDLHRRMITHRTKDAQAQGQLNA